MRTTVYIALNIVWILWVLPFAILRVRGTRKRGAKTAPVSILGMVLQIAAYPVVWSSRYFWTHPLELWRILTAAALAAAALALIWSAIPALGKQWRLQAGVYEDHELVQSGAYRVVRHPIYASMLAMLFATGLITASLMACAGATVILVIGTEIRVHAEDRLLAGRFGKQFEDYRARVPAYVPFLR